MSRSSNLLDFKSSANGYWGRNSEYGLEMNYLASFLAPYLSADYVFLWKLR